MKKIGVILLLFILAIFLIYAAEGVNPADELKNSFGNVNASDMPNKMNAALHKEITIPSSVQETAKWLFGIESTITFENLIILLAVWIGFVVIIYSIVSIIPLFEDKNFISVIIAVVLTTLASTAGTIQQSSLFIIGLFKFLDITRFSFLKVFIVLLFLMGIIIGVSVLLKKIRSQADLEMLENMGINVGLESKISKLIRRN